MDWDLFFSNNDGNKWPDNEIIKHFNRLIKNKNISKKRNFEIFDFGCGSGNNLLLYLNYSKKINCIDISRKALDKLKTFYHDSYKQGKLNLINVNLDLDNFNFLETLSRDETQIYIDCTCFQHIKVESLKRLLNKIREDTPKKKESFLISKSLCHEGFNVVTSMIGDR